MAGLHRLTPPAGQRPPGAARPPEPRLARRPAAAVPQPRPVGPALQGAAVRDRAVQRRLQSAPRPQQVPTRQVRPQGPQAKVASGAHAVAVPPAQSARGPQASGSGVRPVRLAPPAAGTFPHAAAAALPPGRELPGERRRAPQARPAVRVARAASSAGRALAEPARGPGLPRAERVQPRAAPAQRRPARVRPGASTRLLERPRGCGVPVAPSPVVTQRARTVRRGGARLAASPAQRQHGAAAVAAPPHPVRASRTGTLWTARPARAPARSPDGQDCAWWLVTWSTGDECDGGCNASLADAGDARY